METMTTTPLRCQQTLEPLERRKDALVSPDGVRYPIQDGLVFMGYPADDGDLEAAMEEERVWQGTSETATRDLAFLCDAAPKSVELVNRLSRRLSPSGARALDLGSGAGWGAWLLAEAGYETWMCDFEANSLALGAIYQHRNLRDRVVADGRFPPFADASFDVVVCKEFIHHIEDKEALIAEINRMLRPGGVLAVSDPVMSVSKRLRELRHPDPHESHRIGWPGEYFRALQDNGFDVLESAYRFGFAGRWMGRIRTTVDARSVNRLKADRVTGTLARIPGGGALRVIAEKRREARRVPRPPLAVTSPERVRVGAADRKRFMPLVSALEDAARGLGR